MKDLILGTAQLGEEYGTITKTKKLARKDAKKFILTAIAKGIKYIDTANSYENSEEIIGEAISKEKEKINIITKLSPLENIKDNSDIANIKEAVEKSVFESINRLGSKQNISLLLHRFSHLRDYDSIIWNQLISLKEQGHVKRIGVSVQNQKEAIEALDDNNVSIIQIPINILDWRWSDYDFQNKLAKRKDVLIHARSIYLQGIILREEKDWPIIKNLNPTSILNIIDNYVKKFNRRSRADLCLAWVKYHSWINGIVIGMESENQLEDNLQIFSEDSLSKQQVDELKELFKKIPIKLLSPSSWLNSI